jgi:BioD-like phosphotransacetylase family protein
MAGIYVGSTSSYSGKNLFILGLGLWFKSRGYSVGYMKPVGAMPIERNGRMGDEDAFFVQDVLGLSQDPAEVTPVLVTQDFKARAFAAPCEGLRELCVEAYEKLSEGKDLMLVGGSGSMYSGRYCDVDGVSLVKRLGIHAVIIDRFDKELNYDYLLVLGEALGDRLAGVIINDVPQGAMEEIEGMIAPLLERQGVKVLGILPRDPLLGAIKVADLAERMGGRIVTAHHKADRVVEDFLIGTMQVENFLTHFRRRRNAAIIVGGDRSDVQLVALEGDAPCLILTGNLYPNDIILTRAEVLEIPMVVVREDTFSVAKKMEAILSRHKLRDKVKIQQGAQLVSSRLDLEQLRKTLGL